MVDIQSKEVIDKISEELKVQPALQIPRGLSKEIQLNYNVNPRRKILVGSNTRIITGSGTAMTARTGLKTFLIGISASYIKDVTCDIATGSWNVTANILGTKTNLLTFPVITLTLQDGTQTVMFDKPIEIDPAIGVVSEATYAAGVMSRSLNVFYYEEDPL